MYQEFLHELLLESLRDLTLIWGPAVIHFGLAGVSSVEELCFGWREIQDLTSSASGQVLTPGSFVSFIKI